MKNSESPRMLRALAAIVVLALAAGCDPITKELKEFQIPAINPPRPDSTPSTTAPPALTAPAGNHAIVVLVASGNQIYQCRANAEGYAWVLVGPDARLYSANDKLAGTHYVGPTWESLDGSKVNAHVIAQAPSANPESIAQLLLKADSTSGSGQFSGVTYVQRLRTIGGIAPAEGCNAAGAGSKREVLYSAHYVFFSAD